MDAFSRIKLIIPISTAFAFVFVYFFYPRYRKSLGNVKKNKSKKLILDLEKRAKNNDVKAQLQLANGLSKSGSFDITDMEKSSEYYKIAAENGDSEAQYFLGKKYYKGVKYFKKDLTKSFEWFNKAAEQGHPMALYMTGVLYRKGEGVEKNEKKAFQIYQEASEKFNLPEAYSGLGTLYLYGYGVKKNIEKAKENFEKAAELDYKDAKYLLGLLLEKGSKTVKKDANSAFDYFLSAAKQGHLNSMNKAANYYFKGINGNFNPEEGLNWLKKAANLDHKSSLVALGKYYEFGEEDLNIQRNLETALEYYLRAEKKGSSVALTASNRIKKQLKKKEK
eukprot:TRINITY_DN4273_c0_g1_i1.p1 TRINITY_DN4273_c0_g1~~TRINITY_DN4273_c0_g1_i1.p1  ORF type:complete len:335 (+),score=103.35 TRINITY_DN4273_c0_g1_i1:88-1092(+)